MGMATGLVMTEEELSEIESRIMEVIRRERDVDVVTHRLDHDWIMRERRAQETRIARNEEVRRHIEKWGIIGVLTFIVGAIVHFFKTGNHG